MDLFLSPKEVAALLRISDQTVIDMCNDGKLRHVKVGRQYRIYKEAVEELIGRKVDLGEKPPQ